MVKREAPSERRDVTVTWANSVVAQWEGPDCETLRDLMEACRNSRFNWASEHFSQGHNGYVRPL